MNRIITLLQQKNHYLEKFYSLNESQILDFSSGDFDGLEEFYQTRENILQMIQYLDKELNALQESDVSINSEQKIEIREALAIKDEYVSRILSQDLEILSCIETAKSNIIRELQEVRRAKKAISGYKSKKQERQLDEEA